MEDNTRNPRLDFDGKEGSPIPLAQAQQMTKAFREANPGAVKAVFFGKEILQSVLNQTDAMGIRFYFALDATSALTLVMVGANSAGNDQTDGIIGDMAVPCPQSCDTSSPLNDVAIPPR